jgi:AcrR family transcriptional regulator
MPPPSGTTTSSAPPNREPPNPAAPNPAAPKPAAPPAALRSDAQRNRDRILEVAGEVFAAQGLTASMNDIAAAAGVGVGTVYRRFPERGDLVGAVFEQRLAGLERLSLEATDRPDAWAAIVWLFEQTLSLEAADRGLTQLLEDETLRRSFVERGDTMRSALQSLVARAQAAGQLRDDVGLGDIIVLKRMVTEAAAATRSVRPDYWRRVLTVCLDGLRAAGHRTTLPGPPLGIDEIRRSSDTTALCRPAAAPAGPRPSRPTAAPH